MTWFGVTKIADVILMSLFLWPNHAMVGPRISYILMSFVIYCSPEETHGNMEHIC